MVTYLSILELWYSDLMPSQIWETPFDMTDASFPCSVNRTSGPLEQEDHMNLLNHYLDIEIFGIQIPYEFAANTTNSVGSILAGARNCTPLNGGRNPNFVLLDWVNIGNGSGAAALLNDGITDGSWSQFPNFFSLLRWMVAFWVFERMLAYCT